MLEGAAEVWRSGGFVMWPLALATAVLWWTLGMRLMNLQRGRRGPLRLLLNQARAGKWTDADGVIDQALLLGVQVTRSHPGQVRPRLELEFGALRDQLNRGAPMIAVIVGLAPLIGLLGTVTGMIETFDALATMKLFGRSGGIAGGVSQALVSTQAGLAVAIPGVIMGRVLSMRQVRLETELDELQELLCAEVPRAHA